ncbi:hypothetical protein EYZ11_009956 [Aspergillus tanneri]|uniref:Zn(2)-C6 fungal-type domain-containing protein n=1 Tax=Aspergillus tanneri TaxID=1220188 RepID=A0A4S3J8P4_9EURO|nr:hypothetical protein EYZ11_009956 [Aspergillus tanneri]
MPIRSKTFTGCWTCRARHVKCDEEKPRCRRCRRNNWSCQGYSVRLAWTSSAPRRRLRPPALMSSLSPAAVTAFLTELDDCEGLSEAHRGPFSVFSISGTSEARSVSPSQDVGHNRASTSPPERALSTLSQPFFVADEEAFSMPSPSPPEPMLNPTPLARREIELIHHWVVFLSGQMLLLDRPDNPCRTVFLPLALQGLSGPTEASTMPRAVFHAVCAASAFSLFHLRGEPRFQSMAIVHDQQALGHLRRTLRPGTRLDESTLVAVLACITAEAMSGRRGRWRTHVAGGLGLLEDSLRASRGLPSARAAPLLQSYLCLSSLCHVPLSAPLVALLDGPPALQHYMERSHGVTPSLVQFLAQIGLGHDGGTSAVSRTVAELDQLELQLYLQFPRSPSALDEAESRVVQHSLNAFYYATLIYFRRTLRHAPLADVQQLVALAVGDLEGADALTGDHGGCAYNWAGFVVAAECEQLDLQQRVHRLFNRKRRHGIKNIDGLWEIVQTLWQRRRAWGREVHWEEVAREADFDIMLV